MVKLGHVKSVGRKTLLTQHFVKIVENINNKKQKTIEFPPKSLHNIFILYKILGLYLFCMDSKNIIPCIICCIFLGGSAIFYLYGASRLITLKSSNEMVSGTIDKVELHSSGRYLTYSIICSFTYKEQFYNIELSVSDIFPFVGSVYKEYPVGDTTFLINYEYGIAFPQNNINMEIRRRLYRVILFIILLIFSIRVFVKGTNDKNYKKTNQDRGLDLSQVTPFGKPIPYNKTLDVNTQSENKQDNITDDKKNEEIERLEKIFDSSTDENEKGIIAKKLYDLGVMYYWRFIPRDKIL